jgi:hypothetical protein
MADAMSTDILEIIDLNAPDLPSNDRDIYEVVLEQMLANSVESGVEASNFVAPVAAASAEAAEPANKEPAPDATAVGQLAWGPTGVFGAPESSAATKAAMEVILLNSHEFEEALSLNSQTQSLTEGAPAI